MATGTGTTDFTANTIAGDATAPDTLKRQIVLIGTAGANAAVDLGALQGSLTEAAPGTDTASSGINGRLQRIAQRLTSLIGLLPAALVGGRLDVNIGAGLTEFAEDTAHTTGDKGGLALVVRRDADTSLVDTTGDYAPLQVDANGYLKVNIKAGAGSGGTALADNAAFTPGTTSMTPMGAEVDDTGTTAATENSAGVLRMTPQRGLHVNLRTLAGAEVLLPAALGQGTMAQGLRVVLPSDQSALAMARSQGSASTVGLTSGLSGVLALTGLGAAKLFKILSFGDATIVALKYQVSHDGTNWFDLRSPSGALVTQAVTQTATTDVYDVPAEVFGALQVRVVAVDSTQTLVSKTTASCLIWQGAS